MTLLVSFTYVLSESFVTVDSHRSLLHTAKQTNSHVLELQHINMPRALTPLEQRYAWFDSIRLRAILVFDDFRNEIHTPQERLQGETSLQSAMLLAYNCCKREGVPEIAPEQNVTRYLRVLPRLDASALEEGTCPICGDSCLSTNQSDVPVQLTCNQLHVFCLECITTWLKSLEEISKASCPMCRTELFQHGVTETPLLEHPEDLPDLEYPELPDFVRLITQKITELLQTSCQKIPKEVYCDATRPEEASEARHIRPSIRAWYILDPCQEEMSAGQILDILKGWQQHSSDNLPTAHEKFALAR